MSDLLSKKSLNSFFLVILILCSINFFELQSVKGSFVRYIQFFFQLVAVLVSLPYTFFRGKIFVFSVQMIFFSVLLSLFISTLTRDQNLIDSIGGSVPVLVWGVFFYLYHLKFPIEKIEKIVIGYGILYLILYFFQLLHPDKNYFIDETSIEFMDLARGITRIVFPGRGLFYLTIFIAINKLTTSKKKHWFWIFFSIMGIVVTIMQVTRQFIFSTFVIYLIHFLKDVHLYKKFIIIVLFVGAAVIIFNSNIPLVTGLKDTQEQTQELGSDYVRIKAATFFLVDFSSSTINRIFGNGVPYGNTSPYMIFTGFYVSNYGFWLSDVGLVAVYTMFGIFAVLGYFILWIKSFKLKLPKEYFYLKYYLWFLLMTCLTSDTIYSSYDLITTVLVVYIYQTIYEREKSNISAPSISV